jgi:hypothetical protein
MVRGEYARSATGGLSEAAGDFEQCSAAESKVTSEAWRRERLYLYTHWLVNRNRLNSNVVGGAWQNSSITEDARRWRARLQGLDEADALERIDTELARRFGKPWDVVLREATSPQLATDHLPIWNAATGSLLPARLGPLTIFRAESYPGHPELGWSYNYSGVDGNSRLTLTAYHLGYAGLHNGVADPRLPSQLNAAWAEVTGKVISMGGVMRMGAVAGPTRESDSDRCEHEVHFLGMQGRVLDAEGSARRESVWLRVFRGHFLKVRYTRRFEPADETRALSELRAVRADVADFVGSYA